MIQKLSDEYLVEISSMKSAAISIKTKSKPVDLSKYFQVSGLVV